MEAGLKLRWGLNSGLNPWSLILEEMQKGAALVDQDS